LTFTCNICGARNTVEALPTEPATCACGSNVRLRALAHLLSMELFGESLPLAHFPRLKSIRCAGMTDKDCIADILVDKFDYTNTHYDREPRLDITESHPGLEGTYDFILCADVLEHLPDPLSTLKRLKQAAKPDATFIISLPNVAHLAVRTMLLFGRFPKMERGILDKTHLQFFTKDTAKDLLTHAGLRVERTLTTVVPLEDFGNGLFTKSMMGMQRLAVAALPRMFAMQWIFIAKPAPQ